MRHKKGKCNYKAVTVGLQNGYNTSNLMGIARDARRNLQRGRRCKLPIVCNHFGTAGRENNSLFRFARHLSISQYTNYFFPLMIYSQVSLYTIFVRCSSLLGARRIGFSFASLRRRAVRPFLTIRAPHAPPGAPLPFPPHTRFSSLSHRSTHFFRGLCYRMSAFRGSRRRKSI